MIIMLAGSMHFAKEMLDAKKKLEELGHDVLLPGDVHECFTNPDLQVDLDGNYERNLRYCLERDLLREGLNKIEKSDAILIVNHPKNGIPGYIGSSSLMALGVAFYLKKKIFLLSEVDKSQKYVLEVNLTNPVIINGDLSRIV